MKPMGLHGRFQLPQPNQPPNVWGPHSLFFPARRFLADLAEAQRRGCAYDGRRQSWDFMTLPGAGQWLAQAQLLVTDRQHVLLYDRQLGLLGALSFVDRPVS